MSRVGIFGGAFNPIHYGHLFIARESIEKFKLEKVIFVPTGNPVFPKEDLLDKHIRLKFVQVAISGKKGFDISSFEIEREEPSYFVNTLFHIIKKEKCEECYSIIGEDAFLQFHKWKSFNLIIENSKIIVAKRFEGNFEKAKGYIEKYFNKFKSSIYFLSHPLYPVSSTLIRRRIKEKQSIAYLLPEKVERMIINNGYYSRG